MKKLFSLLNVCLLLALSFTACSDDDDEKVLIPSSVVTNLSFTDMDYEKGSIGGTLTWTLPASEETISAYVIYLSSSATEKGTELDDVKSGVSSYDIPEGTPYKEYIHVVAKNATGEATEMASLAIRDNTTPVVSNLSFTDTNSRYLRIGGEITWTVPSLKEGYEISGYVIYLSEESDKKGEELVALGKEATSYTLADQKYAKFIQVAIIFSDEESEDFAVIAVDDVYDGREFFVLNRGNDGQNNSTIGYYGGNGTGYITDIYELQNRERLGDSTEQLLIYGSKMYATVYGSNTLMVMDLNGKKIHEMQPSENGQPLSPRCMVAEDGKLFVSYFRGHSVAVIDTVTFTTEKEIKVGRYPEQLVVANNNIYVANSGGLDYATGYDKTVSVIDLDELEVVDEIEVLINPTRLAANSKGDVFVISMGDYGAVKNTLQKIDSQTKEVTVLGNASIMSLVNDEIYTVYAQWGDPNIYYYKYDALTSVRTNDNFVTTNISSPYSIDVNPVTGEIIISDFDYNSTSDIYIFDKSGKQTEKFDTGGNNTVGVWFR